jgi:PAS domain S-box-containing protein
MQDQFQALLQEDVYNRLINRLPVAVYTTDKNGVLTYYNAKAAELWGQSPRVNDEKIRYCGSLRLFDIDGTFVPHDRCPMADVLQSHQDIQAQELQIERPDGSRITASVNICSLYEDGKFIGAVNVFQDITAQKKMKEVNWRLAAIVESSDDAIVSKTLDGTVITWNRGAENIFGYSAEEIIGQPITTIIPTEHHCEEEMILQSIRSGKKVDHFETIRIAKDGRRIPVSITVSPIRDEHGCIVGASKIARDISEQLANREKLKELNKQLKRYNKYKDEFIGMATHELKTPIMVIKSNLELLNLMLQEEKFKPLINKTLENVEKLSGLVSDLLDVSKLEAGKLQLNYSTFNINKVLRESIQNIRLTSASHRIELNEQAENIAVHADEQRIEQVFVNLLTNAIKYSPDANRVEIEVWTESDKVCISVRDFGIGIQKNQLEKVFSRFYRVRGLAPSFSGLGIGLFISKKIVERHGGTIWVDSDIGKGSTFYLNIPVNSTSASG